VLAPGPTLQVKRPSKQVTCLWSVHL
jgi:hypothetical protein